MAREDLRRLLYKDVSPDMQARQSGRVVLSGRQPDAVASVARPTRMILPPWTTKLPGSQDFNANLYTSTLAAVVGATVVPVSFQLPPASVGYLQQLIIFCQGPTNATNVTFTLRINQSPVSGFNNLNLFPGVSNLTAQDLNDLQVRLPNGCLVDVLVTNNAATGPWTLGAKIAGWYHTEIEEQDIWGNI